MTPAQEWAVYEARNARANHQYRVSRCAGCGNRPAWDFGQKSEWLCVSCQCEEARKIA